MIKYDCRRTRPEYFSQKDKENLEKILTFYCKETKMSYKQGLNEVAAPFLLLTTSLSNSYQLFCLFMKRNLQDFFDDEEFLSLQMFLKFLEFLLKYHEPDLYFFLKTNDLTPELFATPWFLTVFCSKIPIDLVYILWDLYLFDNDRINILFLALALLQNSKDEIMNSDLSNLPQYLTTLSFKTSKAIEEIYLRAKEIKAKTPKSFLLFILEKSQSHKKPRNIEEILNRLDSLGSFAINPNEIMHNFYRDSLKCPRNCVFCPLKPRYLSYEILDLFKEFPHLENFFLVSQKKKNNLNFLIIDFRNNRTSGILNKSHLVPENQNPSELILSLKELKGKYHIILMGERKTEFMLKFIQDRFQYISRFEDFEELHELHQKHKLEMINHNKENCEFCNNLKSANKSNGFIELFKTLFNKKTIEKVQLMDTLSDNYEEYEEKMNENKINDKMNLIYNKEKSVEFSENKEEKIGDKLKEISPNINEKNVLNINDDYKKFLNENNPIIDKNWNKELSYKKFIEQNGFPILQTNKENYFSQFNSKKNHVFKKFTQENDKENQKTTAIKTFNKNTVFYNKIKDPLLANYAKTGLLRSIIFEKIEERLALFKSFQNQNDSFSWFLCRKIKETSPGYYIMKNSILILIDDAILTMKFDKKIIKILEKFSAYGKKKVIDENTLNDNEKFKIKSFFPLKTLFKISSKKFNTSILSFYYKTPTLGKVKNNFPEYLNFIQNIETQKNFLKKQKGDGLNLNDLFKEWHLEKDVNILFILELIKIKF